MTSILGSGDPGFYAEADKEEATRQFQLEWEDLQMPDGDVLCRGCEHKHNPRDMYDRQEDDLIWKYCANCEIKGY